MTKSGKIADLFELSIARKKERTSRTFRSRFFERAFTPLLALFMYVSLVHPYSPVAGTFAYNAVETRTREHTDNMVNKKGTRGASSFRGVLSNE